ncbi:hypothetical protein O181_030530 [Austropuccinia psidii MF-1]|uniref:Histidine kinase n=1 Tax=Austropuccinia psidii MF-1 TaxID=1389203 RepID=A0A9Q3CWD6_9BASI|nr:hypothetical protein [Austropuccinia psidii MF-1]
MNISFSNQVILTDDEVILDYSWSWRLVILSLAICWLGAFTTCAIISHANSLFENPDNSPDNHLLEHSHSNLSNSHPSVTHSHKSHRSHQSLHLHWYLWTGLASVIYGSVSIWGLHFLAMLAQSFETSKEPLLDPTLTILSAIVATLCTFAALSSADRPALLSNYFQSLFSRSSFNRLTALINKFLELFSKIPKSHLSFSRWVSSTPFPDSSSSLAEPLLELEVGPLSPVLSILSSPMSVGRSIPSNDILTSDRPLPKQIGHSQTWLQKFTRIKLSVTLRAMVWTCAIGLMHYIGIKAIDIPGGRVILAPIPMLLSVLLGFCVSILGCVVMDMELTIGCQLLCATVMSFGVFGFHYTGILGMKIISSPRHYPAQRRLSSMDIALIIGALAIGTCLISIGLLAHTASLARSRMLELLKTKRQLGQLSLEKQQVDRTATLKQNFISVASHELRTPLFSVTGYSELLARTNLNNEQRWCLNNLQQACSNMQLIIANVLDFSKLERNNAESWAKPVCVNIREMLEGIAQMIEDKGSLTNSTTSVELIVQVTENVPETAFIDQTFVIRICMNLLSNALKFTEHGFIMIVVDIDAVNQLVIKVQDTGIGIPAAFMSALFEPYRQADSSTTRPHQGTGLGLSICKQLVERLDGIIEVHSIEGIGTTFTVHIPFTRPTSPPRSLTERQRRTICLAYQEKAVEDKLDEILKNDGHQTVTIHNNPELVSQRLNNGQIELVLADFQSFQSSKILKTAIDRGECSTKGRRPFVDDTVDGTYPTFVLTSSTDLDQVANENLLIGARNVIKLRRQGIIPHLIFDMLLAPNKYAHEIEGRTSKDGHQSSPEKFRRLTLSSINSLSPTVFQFDPSSQPILDSPCSTPPGTSNDDKNNLFPFDNKIENYEIKNPKPKTPEKSPKILLVDDNFLNVQLGKKLLHVLGYEVEVAFDGFEAIEKAEKCECGLILMDCQMPGMDGLEATKKIRDNERNQNHIKDSEAEQDKQSIPIIALTANVSPSDEMNCLTSGMDGFLSKPLRLDVLKATLHTFLG